MPYKCKICGEEFDAQPVGGHAASGLHQLMRHRRDVHGIPYARSGAAREAREAQDQAQSGQPPDTERVTKGSVADALLDRLEQLAIEVARLKKENTNLKITVRQLEVRYDDKFQERVRSVLAVSGD